MYSDDPSSSRMARCRAVSSLLCQQTFHQHTDKQLVNQQCYINTQTNSSSTNDVPPTHRQTARQPTMFHHHTDKQLVNQRCYTNTQTNSSSTNDVTPTHRQTARQLTMLHQHTDKQLVNRQCYTNTQTNSSSTDRPTACSLLQTMTDMHLILINNCFDLTIIKHKHSIYFMYTHLMQTHNSSDTFFMHLTQSVAFTFVILSHYCISYSCLTNGFWVHINHVTANRSHNALTTWLLTDQTTHYHVTANRSHNTLPCQAVVAWSRCLQLTLVSEREYHGTELLASDLDDDLQHQHTSR